ncbi:thioesterase II family protein [Streptomyces sp. NBC_00233]|uniref:thioesterase II family protein n=1 Tax=Streptomyces sp. NBC_00233 TaxID=2975686 RepID=UPI00225015CB|nr:alpha/beta fold hydrolase [Streptomyces sp. NBC_00233]MCX5233278.1 alpha/beta fold hydrolase [Streptomyces sp. NBC_00233]
MSEQPWTAVLRPARGTRRGRVVVLSHSGAGPNALLPLLRRLPSGLEIVGVTLPGRERRFGEGLAALDDLGATVAAVLGELRAAVPLSTVLFGHSMGAAFAAALSLSAPELCQGLVLSAYPTPETRAQQTEDWTEEDLLRILELSGNTPHGILGDLVLREHLLGVLRYDLTLGRRLATRIAGRRLPVAPIVLGGADDELVPPDKLDQWSTCAAVRPRLFPGGHFYLLDEANLDAVAAEIAAALPRTAGKAPVRPEDLSR